MDARTARAMERLAERLRALRLSLRQTAYVGCAWDSRRWPEPLNQALDAMWQAQEHLQELTGRP